MPSHVRRPIFDLTWFLWYTIRVGLNGSLEMRIEPSVDPQDNRLGSVYIRVSGHAVARTLPMSNSDDPGFLVDVDRRGKLVGVEVLGFAVLHERKVDNMERIRIAPAGAPGNDPAPAELQGLSPVNEQRLHESLRLMRGIYARFSALGLFRQILKLTHCPKITQAQKAGSGSV